MRVAKNSIGGSSAQNVYASYHNGVCLKALGFSESAIHHSVNVRQSSGFQSTMH